MATSKKTRRSTATPGYRGRYVEVVRSVRTKGRKAVEPGQVLLVLDDVGDDGWVPVLCQGRPDHLRPIDVRLIDSTAAKQRPTAAQQAARSNIVKRAGVIVSESDATAIRSQWR